MSEAPEDYNCSKCGKLIRGGMISMCSGDDCPGAAEFDKSYGIKPLTPEETERNAAIKIRVKAKTWCGGGETKISLDQYRRIEAILAEKEEE